MRFASQRFNEPFVAAINAWRRAADTLVPPGCLCCEAPVDRSGTACTACWNDLRFIERPFCEVLGAPFSVDLGPGALSAEAIAQPPPFVRARAAVSYRGAAERLVTALKYSDRTDLAPWMAGWMWRAARDLAPREGETLPVLVPVPLHRSRLLRRSTNQAAELARALARLSGYEHRPGWLRRTRATRSQVGLGRKGRVRNVAGAFEVPDGAHGDLAGRRVILVDDVFTTGATLAACARALKRRGASQVDCLCFARVVRED